jgi:hypothetical protein
MALLLDTMNAALPKPTIEVPAKLASILEVSLDYLVGKSDLEMDTETLKNGGNMKPRKTNPRRFAKN